MRGKLVAPGKVMFEGWVPASYFRDIESYNYVPLWPDHPSAQWVDEPWVQVTFTVERKTTS